MREKHTTAVTIAVMVDTCVHRSPLLNRGSERCTRMNVKERAPVSVRRTCWRETQLATIWDLIPGYPFQAQLDLLG